MQLANVVCTTNQDKKSFANFCKEGSTVQRIVTQVLPAVLVILWQNAIMPLALYGITLFESTHVSLSSLDSRILVLFFWWNCFNVFFGSMIAGSLLLQIQKLIERPGQIMEVLGESLAISSNFFINYLAIRAFGLVPFRLVLVHGGIWRWLGKCALHPCAAVTSSLAIVLDSAPRGAYDRYCTFVLHLWCVWLLMSMLGIMVDRHIQAYEQAYLAVAAADSSKVFGRP
jgi:hypothetical protein